MGSEDKLRAGEWRGGLWYPTEEQQMDNELLKTTTPETKMVRGPYKKKGGRKKKVAYVPKRHPGFREHNFKQDNEDAIILAVKNYRKSQKILKMCKEELLFLIEGEK